MYIHLMDGTAGRFHLCDGFPEPSHVLIAVERIDRDFKGDGPLSGYFRSKNSGRSLFLESNFHSVCEHHKNLAMHFLNVLIVKLSAFTMQSSPHQEFSSRLVMWISYLVSDFHIPFQNTQNSSFEQFMDFLPSTVTNGFMAKPLLYCQVCQRALCSPASFSRDSQNYPLLISLIGLLDDLAILLRIAFNDQRKEHIYEDKLGNT